MAFIGFVVLAMSNLTPTTGSALSASQRHVARRPAQGVLEDNDMAFASALFDELKHGSLKRALPVAARSTPLSLTGALRIAALAWTKTEGLSFNGASFERLPSLCAAGHAQPALQQQQMLQMLQQSNVALHAALAREQQAHGAALAGWSSAGVAWQQREATLSVQLGVTAAQLQQAQQQLRQQQLQLESQTSRAAKVQKLEARVAELDALAALQGHSRWPSTRRSSRASLRRSPRPTRRLR